VVADEELVRRLARTSGLSRSDVSHFLELDVVEIQDGTVWPALVRRLRRVRRMRRDLGLSLDAVVIIMRLVDRIEALEGTRLVPAKARVLDRPPS
jgi:MerR HTH family regulatory protein